MSPPQRHVPVRICGDSSPMSPALTTSVLHGTRASPVSARWGSSPISSRAPGLLSSPPSSAAATPSRCAVSCPSLHGADSSTSCSVYSLSPSTASALWGTAGASPRAWCAIAGPWPTVVTVVTRPPGHRPTAEVSGGGGLAPRAAGMGAGGRGVAGEDKRKQQGQGVSRVVTGKTGLHARVEGERVIALESW